MKKDTITLQQLKKILESMGPENILVRIEHDEHSIVLPASMILGYFQEELAVPNILQAGPILEFTEEAAIPGNGSQAPFGGALEVWEIRSVSLTSDAGATYNIQDSGSDVSPGVAIGAGATGELIDVPIPMAGNSLITINNGLVADLWNIKAIRLK